jgi:XTP/dITP diphosphohydrolase
MTINQILVFTQNKGKVAEFHQMLSSMGADSTIEILDANDVPEAFRNPEETGDTFVENALIKAIAGVKATGAVTLADDSGLLVDALDGAPGVRSSRFAADGGWQASPETEDVNSSKTAANNKRLLDELNEVPIEMRTARFSCALALALPASTIGDEDKLLLTDLEIVEDHPGLPEDWLAIVAEGWVEGRILEEMSGDEGFGYDPLFYSFDLQESFGQANREDKAAVSHRGRALSNLWHGLLSGDIL